jgi:hypothetical protein
VVAPVPAVAVQSRAAGLTVVGVSLLLALALTHRVRGDSRKNRVRSVVGRQVRAQFVPTRWQVYRGDRWTLESPYASGLLAVARMQVHGDD